MPLNRPHIMHYGISKPLIDEGVAARFLPVRVPNNTDFEALTPQQCNEIKAIAAGGGHDPIDSRLFNKLPKLEIVASFGVGYDHIDAVEAAKRGIIVTHTPDVLTDDVADIAMALLLSAVRQTAKAERFLRAGLWRNGAFPLSSSLRERKIGIVGLGRIGKAIARRLEGFGVPISYCGRTQQSDVKYPYYADVVSMAQHVDTLILAAPGGASSNGLVNMAVFKALGSAGIVVNIGRGSVINEDDLVSALQTNIIAGAGLDVFTHEPKVPEGLLACENAVLLPHIGSGSHHTRNAMARLVVQNLESWFAGKGPVTPVPETPFQKKP